jgi:hypothetical protein
LALKEQVQVWPRWALQELMEQKRELKALELRALPQAWAVVWAQTVLLQTVLARPLRGRLVCSPAFVVLLDATRAAARFGAEVPLVVKVQTVWAMVLLPQEPQVCWASKGLLD